MKFVVCGSGDSIGMPGLFCDCRLCRNARQLKGRDVRTRAGYLLGDEIKFDIGPDTLMQAQNLGLDMSKMRHLFITHSHTDHFYPEDFWTHRRDVSESTGDIQIYGNGATIAKIRQTPDFEEKLFGMYLHEIKSGDTVEIGEVRVTAIETYHIPTEDCLMYYIETPDKNILIANDSDRFPEKTYAALEGKKVDHMFIDCTWGLIHYEGIGHMGLPAIRDTVERLKKMNVLDENSYIYPTHFSHNGSGTHAEMSAEMEKDHNFIPAFDGLIVE